jgi:hypothetical protein
MPTWQAALIFAILIAVVLAISSNGATTIESGIKAMGTAGEISPVPIEPDDQPNRMFQQNDDGWDPVRLTDW